MTDEFTTPDASPRDYVPRGDAEARAKVPRDQWDRYLMPHLDGTKPARNKGFTRVSTIKSGLSNQTGIKVWTGEKIVEGLGQDTELVEASMRAATIVDPEDRKRALRKIADRAFVVGGGKDRSGKGTEFHEITEDINRAGGDAPDSAMVSDPNLDAYYTMLHNHDVQILPDMLERQVLCPYNMAGTFDNMVRWWNPDTEEWELCIADLKTGRDLSLGWLEILMQLWSYANAYGMWTTTDVTTAADGTITDVQGYYEPMPLELRKDKALIFHVPLDGTATLYVLDLSGVERYVAAAVEAKRANAEAKHKVRKVGTVTPAAFVAPGTITMNKGAFDGTEPLVIGRPVEQPGQMTIDGQPPAKFYASTEVGALVAEGIMHGRAQAEPDGPWAPVRQPTADQQAQADKAAERLAKVAAMSNPNTDGDDETIRPFAAVVTAGGEHVERDPVTGRKKRTCGHCRKPGHTQKNCPENPASAKYTGPGAEIDPDPMPLPGEPALGTEAERDQQAYDYAATTISPAFAAALAPNHQNTVLAADMADGDDAPPPPVRWNVPALGTEPLTEAEREADALLAQPENRLAIAVEAAGYDLATAEDRRLLAEAELDYDGTEDVRQINLANVAKVTVEASVGDQQHGVETVPSDLPWCHLAHAHDWTSTHPAAPGQWVCSVSGKPSREAYEKTASQGPYAPPLPVPHLTPLEREAIHNNPAVATTIAPPAWAAPGVGSVRDYAAAVAVLDRIASANTQAELLRLRADAIEAGHWVESLHNGPAMARYQALA